LVHWSGTDQDIGIADARANPHDTLVRNASTCRRNDVPAVELILELLPILPGKEALGGSWPIQYSIHGRQS
jgi:hypothetical protein